MEAISFETISRVRANPPRVVGLEGLRADFMKTTGSGLSLEDLRALVQRLQISLPVSEGSQLAVVLEVGHSDTGAYEHRLVRVNSVVEGHQLIAGAQEDLLRSFAAELMKIHEGIAEGYLIDDGSSQYVIAQVLADGGEEEPVVPVAGFAMSCAPADLTRIEEYELDWELTWSELFEE
jgi:hypothetical protein